MLEHHGASLSPHLFPIGACTLDVPVIALARLENGLGAEES